MADASPTNTRVKIRYGLILQGVLARALTAKGYAYDETPAYDDDSEVPDFLIPNAEEPEFAVEVNQTDARDHFRMKTLRSLTAVAEVKAFFGPDVVSVNVLFGDPDSELPEANLRAMCGIFDVNVLLRRDADEAGRATITALEAAALELAKDTNVSTADAAEQLVKSHGPGVTAIGELMGNALASGAVNGVLTPMWQAEQERRNALSEPPTPGNTTFYKKNIVRSLYFQDSDFDAMVEEVEPDAWPESAQQQTIHTKIGEVTEDIDGDHIEIDPEFAQFLRDPDAPRLRGLCKAVLDESEAMHWFFEDIRDSERRRNMVDIFLERARAGDLKGMITDNILGSNALPIQHCRNWVIDVATRCLGISQNNLSRLIYTDFRNVGALGDPVSHIAPNTERFRGLTDEARSAYVDDLFEAIELLRQRMQVDWNSVIANEVDEAFLDLRLLGAMRLRQLDALPLMAEAIARSLGLVLTKIRVTSVLSDLADEPAVGRFELFEIASNAPDTPKVLINLVATEGNPRDKAKEWGARRLATLYRQIEGYVVPSEYSHAVFVLDGTWEQSDVTRLFRSGWDRVIRMGELEDVLRENFSID